VAVPELAVRRIKNYCADKTPAELRDQMRLEVDVRGNSVTISDCRRLWLDEPGEWTRMRIAQLRYDPSTSMWSLYWADRNSRWHRYDDLEATMDLDEVIAEIDGDPTCIFFG
jgi:hypothetical protein